MTARKHSRRDFIKLSGLALGGAAVACSGLGYAATRAPDISTPELAFAEDTSMNKRILVTYATRAGSTPEIAAAIGATLSQRGFSVDVIPVKSGPAPDGYDAVILGSAIRMGSWLPEMVEFIKVHQSALRALPVALFTVHMLNTADDETSRAARHAYLNTIRPLVKPVDEVFFAGVIDPGRLSFLDRVMVQMVKSPVGDYRDWNKIRGWANEVLAH